MFHLLLRSVACTLMLASAGAAQNQLRLVSRYAIGKSADASLGTSDSLLVMADGNGTVVALKPDLRELWRHELKVAVSAPPAITSAGIVIGGEDGRITLLDPASGDARWAFKAQDKVVGRPAFAAVADRSVIIAGSYDTHVYCLNAADGKEVWRFKTDAQVHASPLPVTDFVAVGGCDGRLRAIAIDSGKEKWSADLGGAIATSPVLDGERIFAATMSGEAFAIGLDGKILWRSKPLADSDPFTASPAVAADVVVFISESGQLVSLRAADGSRVASTRIQAKPSINLLVIGDDVVAGTDDGKVLLVDPRSAQVVHRATVGGMVHTLSSQDGKLAVCTSEGVLWLLAASK